MCPNGYCQTSQSHVVTLANTCSLSPFYQDQTLFAPVILARFMSLRKNHCAILAANPRAKPRHEKVDTALFTRKKEEDYIDVKQELSPANTIIDGHNLNFITSNG